ncbi:MAG: OsmC family peroxiredoxin [Gemmatimonadaceae bacterium]
MPTRNATAIWKGGLRGGNGSFNGESGVVSGAYSFGSRFESAAGSNPEELLAAAEAACFSMALSLGLEQAGFAPESVETHAACTIEQQGGGFTITTMALKVRASVPGIDQARFQEIAEQTKEGCPVSKVMHGNVKMEMDAALV